jgi:hypothetical protein
MKPSKRKMLDAILIVAIATGAAAQASWSYGFPWSIGAVFGMHFELFCAVTYSRAVKY